MAHPDCMLCIRHGQTAWNAEDRLTTRTDVPLDDRGRAQAALVAQSLRGARFARAYASPRRRAHDTAKLALTGVDQAPEIRCDERLVELDAGPFEGFRFPDLPRAAGRGVPCLPAGNRPTDPRRLREPAGLRRPGPCVPGRGRRTRGPLARREPQPLHPRARLRGARRRPGHVPPLQALERPRGAREVPPGAAASARRAQHPARLSRRRQVVRTLAGHAFDRSRLTGCTPKAGDAPVNTPPSGSCVLSGGGPATLHVGECRWTASGTRRAGPRRSPG
jgi:hypothetical protein